MSYWLGIDVGTTYTAAAICRTGAGRRVLPEVVPLGSRANAVSSVVYLAKDGQVVVGEAAERRAVTNPDRVVRGFKRRIGDEVPLIIGGNPYSAPRIAAMVIRWVVDRVAEREGGAAAGIVITHPAGWGAYKLQTMADALRTVGLPDAVFRTEPEAAAASYASQERIGIGSTIAVYDFGGGTFDAAVIRKGGASAFSVLGIPQGIEHLGGIDFDDAVFDHVVTAVPGLRELDPDSPATLAATAALRRQCTEAKEALSVDTEVAIPVLAPGIQSQVRLVRSEFEDMIRLQVAETVEALRRALRSADLNPPDLDAVLLVGGSSRVPLVAQLVSAELGRPVVVDADPKAAIALGAALSARPVDVHESTEVAEAADADIQRTAVHQATAAEPTSVQSPPRPSPSVIPLEVQPAQSLWHRMRTRRVSQAVGLVALGLAGAGVTVLLLTSQPRPAAPTGAGTATSVTPVTTIPASDSGNADHPDSSGGSSVGAVHPAVGDAPKRARGDAAQSRAATVPVPQTTPARPGSGTAGRPIPASSSAPAPIPTISPSSHPTESSATPTHIDPSTTTSVHSSPS
jgi:actin-like ATPase involved in cell morphogenesis